MSDEVLTTEKLLWKECFEL